MWHEIIVRNAISNITNEMRTNTPTKSLSYFFFTSFVCLETQKCAWTWTCICVGANATAFLFSRKYKSLAKVVELIPCLDIENQRDSAPYHTAHSIRYTHKPKLVASWISYRLNWMFLVYRDRSFVFPFILSLDLALISSLVRAKERRAHTHTHIRFRNNFIFIHHRWHIEWSANVSWCL